MCSPAVICSRISCASAQSEIIEGKGLRRTVRANEGCRAGRGPGGKEGGDNYNEQGLFHRGVVLFTAVVLFYPNRVALCNTYLSRADSLTLPEARQVSVTN